MFVPLHLNMIDPPLKIKIKGFINRRVIGKKSKIVRSKLL